ADGLPVEVAGRAAVLEVAEPVHVRPQFADVAHAVAVRRRREDAGVVVGLQTGGKVARVQKHYAWRALNRGPGRGCDGWNSLLPGGGDRMLREAWQKGR